MAERLQDGEDPDADVGVVGVEKEEDHAVPALGVDAGPGQEVQDPGGREGIDVGRRLDALIVRAFPKVHKAVKWNSPFYGVEGDGWFLSFHCFDKYVKVAFFRGTSLDPMPPGESKSKGVRYLDVRENDTIDEKQFTNWVKQASKLPGEHM